MILRSTLFPTAGGQKATRSIVNSFTQPNWSSRAITQAVSQGAIAANSGAMTANTLKTLLNISGTSVYMSHLTFRVNDTTSRTIRVKITVDGIVACDATSSAITTLNNGCCLAGTVNASGGEGMIIPPIKANSTLLIEYASSLTETDKIITEYVYNTEA